MKAQAYTETPSESVSILSPVTGEAGVVILRTFDIKTLISEYRKIFDLDIERLTRGHQTLSLCKCNMSGYRFYHPGDIVGDSAFYHQLGIYDWYYMRTKWEFEESLKFIQPGSAVLEIGSAKGAFLQSVINSVSNVTCAGLELNKDAAHSAQEVGVKVLIESSAEHARQHPSKYDVVALFQALEHIPNPMNVLRDSITMLKPGGVLVIGVPDNSARASDSIFVKPDNILNMPPHHQGLWDIPSLSFLQKVLPIKLEYLAIEPATASHHSNSYRGLIKAALIRRFGRLFGFVVYAFGRPFYNHALGHLNKYLPAHSVLAVFRKI